MPSFPFPERQRMRICQPLYTSNTRKVVLSRNLKNIPQIGTTLKIYRANCIIL